MSSVEKRLELADSELQREKRDSSVLKQMRRNSKLEETKLFEEKRKAIDLQKDLQKATDDLTSFKTQAAREAAATARELDSAKDEASALRGQKESLECTRSPSFNIIFSMAHML